MSLARGEITVNVRGLRELRAALKHAPAQVRAEVRRELKAVGEPVAADARSRLAAIGGSPKSVSGIKSRVKRDVAVVIEQTRRRVTGKRGDWGKTIMVRSLLPAAKDARPEVERRLEAALDRLARDWR